MSILGLMCVGELISHEISMNAAVAAAHMRLDFGSGFVSTLQTRCLKLHSLQEVEPAIIATGTSLGPPIRASQQTQEVRFWARVRLVSHTPTCVLPTEDAQGLRAANKPSRLAPKAQRLAASGDNSSATAATSYKR
jgi:hypothetical protein